MNDKNLSKAAHNLLIDCAGLTQSDSLLIVREQESLGWYKNDISEYILNLAKVVTVPGDGFGAQGHIRFSYATNTKTIRNGIKKVKNALKKLKDKE